jgi:uncharacterized protein (DUF2236 family)
MDDRGYFPAGESVLRRVHSERAVGLLYGQRALLMQATHPVAFTGLLASSGGRGAPFKRLARTAQAMESVFFGSCSEADRVTTRVRRMHARVRGRTSTPAGPHPAGTPYAADQPDMMLWILGCLADSALVMHKCFVGPLSRSELDRYWDDYLRVGELFGLTPRHAPATYSEFRRWFRARLESGELYVTDEARKLGTEVAFELPLPARRRPALPAINLAVAGTLPAEVRRMYGIAWTPAHDAAFRSLVLGSRLSRPIVPAALKRGACAGDYEVVARAEARRLRRAA